LAWRLFEISWQPRRAVSARARQSLWRATLRRANRELADAGVAIAGLTFHDLRSKAIDDAAERGRDPVAFASHSDSKVTRRHYLRRAKRQTPLE